MKRWERGDWWVEEAPKPEDVDPKKYQYFFWAHLEQRKFKCCFWMAREDAPEIVGHEGEAAELDEKVWEFLSELGRPVVERKIDSADFTNCLHRVGTRGIEYVDLDDEEGLVV